MYRIRLNTASGPSEHGLFLPARILAGFQLKHGCHCEIQVGQKIVRTTLGAASQSRISGELKQRLRLPPGVLRLHVDIRDGRLVLGPFLGIMARPQISSPYGEQTSFFRRLIARAKAMHIYAFVFGPDDVQLENALVNGHRPYKSTSTWVTRRCPVPDVVFDRGFFKAAEKKRAQKLKDRLVHDYGVRLFNEDIGSKLDVYRTLMQDDVLAGHLPETASAETQEAISDFLQRYKMVYLKPAYGNQGRNVFRVSMRRNRVAYEGHLKGSRIVRSSAPNMPGFMRVLADTGERSPFIVQQGLHLAKVQGRAADVRALVQRDRAGQWRLTGAGVRIGGSTLVSNLHAGGSAARLDVLVPRPERKTRVAQLQARIADITLRVAEQLSRRNLLGELGIDLGLDEKGHLWIIEVNLRPGRATFRQAGLDEAWRRSGIAPLEFSIYLWIHPDVALDVAAEKETVELNEPAYLPPIQANELVEEQVSIGEYVPVLTTIVTEAR